MLVERYKEIRIKPKKKKYVEEMNSLLKNRKWESCPSGLGEERQS